MDQWKFIKAVACHAEHGMKLLMLSAMLAGGVAMAQTSTEVEGKAGDSFMLMYHDVNVSVDAASDFNEGLKLSLMLLPSRYADALALLNSAKLLNHPYAPLAILVTTALANHQNYEFKQYSEQIMPILNGEDPLGIVLAAFTLIEATDYLKYNNARPVIEALNKALAQSYVPAWYVKGLLLIKLGYSSTGVDEIKQAADLGYAVAQYHLSYMILSGHIKMDKRYAFSLLQKALNAGHFAAYRELGYCYEHGLGTKVDVALALEMYRQGFNHGDVSAAASYGLLMLQQDRPNYVDSFNALSFAYNNDIKNVANALGTLYIKGLGVMMNQERGFALIKQAADNHDILAINNVIACYRNGTGTRVDLKQAQHYEALLHQLKRQQRSTSVSLEHK